MEHKHCTTMVRNLLEIYLNLSASVLEPELDLPCI
jgi:hypothetical protein